MLIRKKIAIKIISIFIFAIVCILSAKTVKAESVVIGNYVDKIYIKKMKGGYGQYLRSQWVFRASDYQFVYCLEPWVLIDDEQNYEQLWSWNESSNISYAVWNKVKLIAYYGYGYDSHNEDYWYTVTQMLIWKEIDPGADIYFTDALNGNRINIYENEMNEITRLVNSHYILPSFVPKLYTTSISKDYELIDTNNVLKLFEIKNDNQKILKSKEDNKLVVFSDQEKTASIDLVKKTNRYNSVPFIYVSQNSQNVMTVGKFDDLNTNVNFKFVSGSIEIQKLDKETNSNMTPANLTLENAEYELFDDHGQLVSTLTTDSNGKASILNLPLGKYTLKEKKESYGYKIDNTNYEIELLAENRNQIINVYEELDKKTFLISKKYVDLDNNTELAEKNITFEIYNHEDDSFVGTLTTNNKGIGTIDLIYGTYTIKQSNAKEGFQKTRDFNIIIDKNSEEVIKKNIVNYPYPNNNVYLYPINNTYIKTVTIPNTYLNNNYYIFSFILLAIIRCLIVLNESN